MGDIVDEKANNNYLFQECKDHLEEQNHLGIKEAIKICNCIYGSKDQRIVEKLEKLEDDLIVFWQDQIEALEKEKRWYINSIEQSGKEALKLEKALGLTSGFTCMQNDIPLVELEESVWKLLNSYQVPKDTRLKEYSMLQKKEIELCSILSEKPQFGLFSLSPVTASSSNRVEASDIPSCKEMRRCEKRIKDLEEMRQQLQDDFERYKEELKTLLNDCGILPLSELERFACNINDDGVMFPITKENLEKLKLNTINYRKTKEKMIAEANEYREKITDIYKKIFLDTNELKNFFDKHSGFEKSDLDALNKRLTSLKEERQSKLKDLILGHRKILDELWIRCCYSDSQRAAFKDYETESYSEDVLTSHELKVEELEHFYNENKRIFQLAEKYSELWPRLLSLDEEASLSDRLFDNRGGILLQEEKERKLMQKKVPAIKVELVHLLNEYKATTGNDFLYFGTPLLENLQQMESEREDAKENQKQMRKSAKFKLFL